MIWRVAVALAWATALVLLPLQPAIAAGETQPPPPIVVGGKLGVDQALLTEMTVQLLQSKDIAVEVAEPMGSAIVRKAQETGRVDIYWEDTATSLNIYNKVSDPPAPDRLYPLAKELDAEQGIVWLEPSAVSFTYALAMRAADARELGLSNLSDLAKLVNDGAALTLATSVEFSARPDGLKPMEREYGFKFPRENIKAMDPGATYESLRNEEVDVALVASGDARVASYDLFVFEDDKRVFLTHVLAPVVRSETLERMPELATIVNAFSAKLDNATLRRLNARVEVEDKPLEDVARNFLHEQGLI